MKKGVENYKHQNEGKGKPPFSWTLKPERKEKALEGNTAQSTDPHYSYLV